MKQYTITSYKTTNTNKINSDFDANNIASIFINDTLCSEEDYSIKNNRVVFSNEINPSDIITLNYNIETNGQLIGKGSNNSNYLLNNYNSNVKLNENNKYKIGISIDKNIYEWEFNSKQNPMFISNRKIFEDIGEFIEGFTEEYINNKIYENSLAVIDLIDELEENGIENVSYTIDDNGFYTTKYKAVQNWVRYKTDIDLTLARYFGISYRYGTELKEIGDIKIQKDTKLPYIDNLLDMLNKQFKEADDKIRGVNSFISVVKAGTRFKYDDDWGRDTTW